MRAICLGEAPTVVPEEGFHYVPRSRTGVFSHPFPAGNRERLAWGAGGGNERPCSPARRRRHPDRRSLRPLNLVRHQWITSSLGLN